MNVPTSSGDRDGVGTLFIAFLRTAMCVVLGGTCAELTGQEPAAYAKLAPYAAIRWAGDEPEVSIGEEWVALVSIDGVAVEEIVAFARKRYAAKWRKRFEEDLVEVLTRMGHRPGKTVTLVVRSAGRTEPRTLKDVAVTESNRESIYETAREREKDERMPDPMMPTVAEKPQEPFDELVRGLRARKKLVGLGAMVTVNGQVVASAVAGERVQGSGVAIEPGDRWHLGSVTKSITATMIARLVESGRMDWSDTVGGRFADGSIHADWKPVTVRQLLTHTAGAPANFSFLTRLKQPALGPECTRLRREAVLEVVARAPESRPGETFAYSNVGYTIAAAMAEEATGSRWEELVRQEVFEPLGLIDAGFGPPKSAGTTIEQPQGHRAALWWKTAVGEDADNTMIMGPAGVAHMTLSDLAKYGGEHLGGELGAKGLLAADTYKRLHTAELDDYACGWVVKRPSSKIPHTVYWHNGSNTMWYALVVFIPDRKMVVAVTSNDGDVPRAESAAWAIVEASVKQFHDGDNAEGRTAPVPGTIAP